MLINNPTVSILIPNFNHSKFLDERIQSILNQSYQDFEIIFLDDCSTDNSKVVIEKYINNPKVSVCVYNDKNSGSPFIQWKKGIELVKGEYLWIAESDDYAHENFLQEMVSLLIKYPNAGLVYCQSWIIDEDSKKLRNNKEWTDDLDSNRWSYDYVNNGKDEINNFLSKKCIIPNASGVLIRKKCIALKDIQVHLKKMGDWYFWISILNNYDVAYCSKTLNFFRETSFSTRVIDTIPKLVTYYEEKIFVLNYLYKITNFKNIHVKNDLKNTIKLYVPIVSVKSLIVSSFFVNNILFKHTITFLKVLIISLDFKSYFLRKFK